MWAIGPEFGNSLLLKATRLCIFRGHFFVSGPISTVEDLDPSLLGVEPPVSSSQSAEQRKKPGALNQ